MAFNNNKLPPCLTLIVVMCIFLFPIQAQSSGCSCLHGKAAIMPQDRTQNRKVLHNLKEKETVPNTDVTGSGRNEGHGNGKTIALEKYWKNDISCSNKLEEYHVELREAPPGPDPLHHHGGIPKNKSAAIMRP